jgi:DDE family transposase/SWIM zinc finger
MAETSGFVGSREARALDMLRGGVRVAETSTAGEYVVASQSGKGLYRVGGIGIEGALETCTCPDFEERLARCKHIYLVLHWLTSTGTQAGSLYPSTSTRKKPINTALYNEAQNEEYRLVHTLLRGLVKAVPEPTRDPHRAGRPPIPIWDQVFCAVQRSYYGFSLRRSQGFRSEAAAKGLLSATPYWAVASRFLFRQDATPILNDLLAASATPLMGIEETAVIDSTGLRTTRFHNYRKEKYEPARENDWRKMHALVCANSHAIAVLEVTDGSANDSPMFPILLDRAHEYGFRFKDVLADRAYQGRANFNAAARLHILPFIPYKRNQTGMSKGSPMYHKMFLFFQYHREEFEARYRQRAQVESTFGGFKQKFGETLVSRNFTAQVNEVLCKAIAHNLTILVRQMFETGLLPDFLRSEGKAKKPAPKPVAMLDQIARPGLASSGVEGGS